MDSGFQHTAALAGRVAGLSAAAPRASTPQLATTPAAAASQAAAAGQRTELQQRLTAVLRAVVEGFACDGAALYLLNSTSNQLLLEAHYHGPGQTEAAPQRRKLAAARADVTALAGEAVVLEDDVAVAGWPVPVWCGAAVCLPVASHRTIHGTLWLYGHEPRAFADAELQLLEVAAGRLAVEYELATGRDDESGEIDPSPAPSPHVSAPRHQPTPPATPLLEDWELAGWTAAETAGDAFYDWQMLPDGRTLIAAGSLLGHAPGNLPWLEAARVALRAHAPWAEDAGDLLTQANQTLWLASPGGDAVAMTVAVLDAEGEHASVALAGPAAVARWRAASCEWHTSTAPPLGWAEQTVYAPHCVDLVIRQRLVLASAQQALPEGGATSLVARRLQKNSPHELRGMPGKRALREFAKAATEARMRPGALALVRRR